ncbi:MAG: hypothetical protein C4321_06620, partial [Chloroflexota bacterium]
GVQPEDRVRPIYTPPTIRIGPRPERGRGGRRVSQVNSVAVESPGQGSTGETVYVDPDVPISRPQQSRSNRGARTLGIIAGIALLVALLSIGGRSSAEPTVGATARATINGN